MANHADKNEEDKKLFKTVVDREFLEDEALGALTSETLQKLNMSSETLQPETRTALEKLSNIQTELQLQELDPISISLHKSREISDKLECEYTVLKLKETVSELQAMLDGENQHIAKLRKILEESKQNLLSQNPNPNNIQEYIRQSKQKLAAYEESSEAMMKKYLGLNIPEGFLPKTLLEEVTQVQERSLELARLKARADEVTFMKETKAKLTKLRK